MDFPKSSYVTFNSDNGLSVTVLHDQPANMTGGFGGWEVVDRPKRVGMTRFKGKDPFRMDIPILFEGYATGDSQEIAIATLSRMAEQPGPMQPPPTLKVSGSVPRDDLTFVIETIDWDNTRTVYDVQGGVRVRLRQAAIVHLLQFVDDTLIFTPPTLAVVPGPKKPGSKTVDAGGKSAADLAAAAFGGSSNLWTLIQNENPWIKDPRAPIPTGTVVKIPPAPHGGAQP